MSKKLPGSGLKALVLSLTVCAGVVAVSGVAMAGNPQIGATVTITAKGHGENLHWSPDATSVVPGDTIHLLNATDEPHTFSLVDPNDEPQTNKEIRHCFDQGICGQIAAAHGVTPPDFKIEERRVDNGQKGLDTPFIGGGHPQDGDSQIFNRNDKNWVVSAGPDQTLHFMCAIHPWMQGTLDIVVPKH